MRFSTGCLRKGWMINVFEAEGSSTGTKKWSWGHGEWYFQNSWSENHDDTRLHLFDTRRFIVWDMSCTLSMCKKHVYFDAYRKECLIFLTIVVIFFSFQVIRIVNLSTLKRTRRTKTNSIFIFFQWVLKQFPAFCPATALQMWATWPGVLNENMCCNRISRYTSLISRTTIHLL